MLKKLKSKTNIGGNNNINVVPQQNNIVRVPEGTVERPSRDHFIHFAVVRERSFERYKNEIDRVTALVGLLEMKVKSGEFQFEEPKPTSVINLIKNPFAVKKINCESCTDPTMTIKLSNCHLCSSNVCDKCRPGTITLPFFPKPLNACMRCYRGYQQWKKREDWKKALLKAEENELIYIHKVLIQLSAAIEKNLDQYSEEVKRLPSQGNITMTELPPIFIESEKIETTLVKNFENFQIGLSKIKSLSPSSKREETILKNILRAFSTTLQLRFSSFRLIQNEHKNKYPKIISKQQLEIEQQLKRSQEIARLKKPEGPVLDTIDPAVFPLSGASTVIRGINFQPNIKVFIGGKEAKVTYLSNTLLYLETPPMKEGYYDILLSNPNGIKEKIPSAVIYSSSVENNSLESISSASVNTISPQEKEIDQFLESRKKAIAENSIPLGGWGVDPFASSFSSSPPPNNNNTSLSFSSFSTSNFDFNYTDFDEEINKSMSDNNNNNNSNNNNSNDINYSNLDDFIEDSNNSAVRRSPSPEINKTNNEGKVTSKLSQSVKDERLKEINTYDKLQPFIVTINPVVSYTKGSTITITGKYFTKSITVTIGNKSVKTLSRYFLNNNEIDCRIQFDSPPLPVGYYSVTITNSSKKSYTMENVLIYTDQLHLLVGATSKTL